MPYGSLITDIKRGGTSHDRALGKLYNDPSLRAQVFSFLLKKGMNRTDAHTIWTDTIIQFGKLVLSDKYQHQENLSGYLLNLARYLLLNQIRTNKRYEYVDLDDVDESTVSNIEVAVYKSELISLFQSALSELGESCSQILSLWSRGYSMEEIKLQMNVVSNEATRKRKHSCLKKLLSNIDANPILKNQLQEYVLDR